MIAIVSHNENNGIRKHLEELFLLIQQNSIKTKLLLIEEKQSNFIIKNIEDLKPDLTIFGGRNWIVKNNHILEKIGGEKGILFCSPLAQTELSTSQVSRLLLFLDWLDKKIIDYIFVSSFTLCRLLNRPEIIHLPAPFTPKELTSYHYPIENSIAIFNNKAPHKNILNTIGGVALSKKVNRLVINGLNDYHYDLAKRFGIEKIICDIGFIPDNKYYSTLKEIKLLLNLSFSESFCYSVIESFFYRIPALVTSAVSWVNISELIVNNPCDINEISLKIDNILSLSEHQYKELSNRCFDLALNVSYNNNEIINMWLSNKKY